MDTAQVELTTEEIDIIYQTRRKMLESVDNPADRKMMTPRFVLGCIIKSTAVSTSVDTYKLGTIFD